jgi:indole-3-glycerol phosphate synthase
VLAETADAPDLAETYGDAGASAVSVLTEPERFGGSLADLADVASRMQPSGVPAMRKDFLVDPYQVLEARAAGAGGVLVIVAMLDDPNLADLVACALEQGLFVLLEAFDEPDLERAARLAEGRAGQILMGLNSRDLRSLAVDPGRLERLATRFPDGWPKVAESGLESPEDAAKAAAAGYDLALVGSALMRSADPGALLAAMLEAGRGSRAA